MKSKRILIILAVIMIATLALAGCQAATASEKGQDNNVPIMYTADQTQLIDLSGNEIIANKLTVSGSGKITVMPDVAYVTAGITTQNKDAKKAQSDNKDKMNALYAALESAGLKEEDIKTIGYSVYPLYNYNNGRNSIYAYQVTNTIRITIKDIEAVGDYIDIAAENGANTDYSISFDLLDESSYYYEALAKAVTNAKAKAEAIATAGGYSITGTLEVTEGSVSYYPQYRDYAYASDLAAESTPISSGELDVSASVSIIYRIG